MRKINKQAGFTLIELIMVIVILGVLSAFALPRFADLGGQARAATINGVAGSMKAASNIAHAQWLAEGDSGSNSVTLEGTPIALAFGYPTIVSIMDAAQITADDFTIALGVVTAKGVTAASLAAATCSVEFTAATSLTVPAVVSPVDVTVC
jgi:MSHA pilin protein MshA